jgi:hypothetical protein
VATRRYWANVSRMTWTPVRVSAMGTTAVPMNNTQVSRPVFVTRWEISWPSHQAVSSRSTQSTSGSGNPLRETAAR